MAESSDTETRLRDELKVARAALEHAAIDAAGREQERLAQALHDTVCQSLSGIHLMARVVARKLQATCPDGARDVGELGDLLQRAAGELHDLARWLRPENSQAPGLVPALADLARVTSGRIPCQFDCAEPIAIADRYVAAQFFQIARESVEHAVARPAIRRIGISLSENDRHIVLAILAEEHAGTGAATGTIDAVLELVQHRAATLGATLTFDSDADTKTTIVCSLPKPR